MIFILYFVLLFTVIIIVILVGSRTSKEKKRELGPGKLICLSHPNAGLGDHVITYLNYFMICNRFGLSTFYINRPRFMRNRLEMKGIKEGVHANFDSFTVINVIDNLTLDRIKSRLHDGENVGVFFHWIQEYFTASELESARRNFERHLTLHPRLEPFLTKMPKTLHIRTNDLLIDGKSRLAKNDFSFENVEFNFQQFFKVIEPVVRTWDRAFLTCDSQFAIDRVQEAFPHIEFCTTQYSSPSHSADDVEGYVTKENIDRCFIDFFSILYSDEIVSCEWSNFARVPYILKGMQLHLVQNDIDETDIYGRTKNRIFLDKNAFSLLDKPTIRKK